jgi:hypothetical protein
MSTSKLVDGTFLKRLVIINALVPALLLAWDGYQGQLGVNAINFLIRTTGASATRSTRSSRARTCGSASARSCS